MTVDYTFHLVSSCISSKETQCFQKIIVNHNFWWWIQHRWFARPKATQVFQILIPSLISGAAFIVAWSQREIASNKYRMDLFEKKAPIIEELSKKIDNIPVSVDDPRKNRAIYLEKINDLIQYLEDKYGLFESVSISEIKELEIKFKKIDKEMISSYHDKENLYDLTNRIYKEKKFLDSARSKLYNQNLEDNSLEINSISNSFKEKEFLFEEKKSLLSKLEVSCEEKKSEYISCYNELRKSILSIKKNILQTWYIPNSPYKKTIIDIIITGKK